MSTIMYNPQSDCIILYHDKISGLCFIDGKVKRIEKDEFVVEDQLGVFRMDEESFENYIYVGDL